MSNLSNITDARVWAEEFNVAAVKLGYEPMDEGWLIAWFANAIMAGYDMHSRMEDCIISVDQHG